jgi:hypothetical protein
MHWTALIGTTHRPMEGTMRVGWRAVTAMMFVGVIGAAIVAASWLATQPNFVDRPDGFVDVLYPPRSDIERQMRMGDGQAYAALASDPTISHPELFREGDAEAAYRWQRPVHGYLTWAASFGQWTWIGPASLAVTVASAAAAVTATGSLARRCGVNQWVGLAVLASPGAMILLRWTGPELLATALGVAATVLWLRDGPEPSMRTTWAVAGIAASAVLTKETLILVPFVLGLHALVVERIPVRRLLPLIAAPAAFLGWAAVLRVRIGHWPWDASQGRLSAPLVGIAEAASRWQPASIAVLACVAVSTTYALRWSRRHIVTWLVVAHAMLASVLGHRVWTGWEDVGRILLPGHAFGVVAVAGALAASGVTARRSSGVAELARP